MEEDSKDQQNRNSCHIRELIIFAVLVVLIVSAIDLVFYPKTMEDAFIAFRYSRHLSQGYGFGAWNVHGDRVEGYSSFLWMTGLAAAIRLGLRVETAAKILGIASHIGFALFLLCFPFLRKTAFTKSDLLLDGHRDIFIIASLISALYLPMAWYASTGMETIAFAFLVLLCLLGPFVTQSAILNVPIGIALVLMRPEGLVFALGCYGVHIWLRRQAGQPVKLMLFALLASGIAFLSLTCFRLVVFNEVFPNTYYAKASGAQGLHILLGEMYLEEWVYLHAWWALILVATICLYCWSLWRNGFAKNQFVVFLFAFMALYLLYIVKAGGDNSSAFPYWRHILHLMPLLSVLLAAGIVAVIPRWRILRYVILAASLVVINRNILYAENARMLNDARQGIEHYPSLTLAPHNPYFEWLGRLVEPDTVVATSMAGELPFVADAEYIDMLGLNDRYIAHYGHLDPYGPVDSKTDMTYVLERRPDIIEGYISATKIIEGQPRQTIVNYRLQMCYEMLENPIFQSEYLFLVNGPYEYLDRALFIHTSYWNKHPSKETLHCIPVIKTSLYDHASEERKAAH
jgi:arabinofuranosyltransferase